MKDGKETLEIKMRLSRKSFPTYHVCNNKSNCYKQVSYLLKEIDDIVKRELGILSTNDEGRTARTNGKKRINKWRSKRTTKAGIGPKEPIDK